MKETQADLYSDTPDVIDTYEDRAFMHLALSAAIPCCLGGNAQQSRHWKKVRKLAAELYALDKFK